MRKLVLFSAIFMTFMMSCNKKNTTEPVEVLALSISGKINCPSRTLTTLNPSEYLITLTDSSGFKRETRPMANCSYAFNDLEMGQSYSIKIVRTVPSGNLTVSTTALESYLVQNPLPQKRDLGLIAGDIDRDGEINAVDLLHLKRFKEGIIPNLPTGGGLWRFMPKAWLTADNNYIPNSNLGRFNFTNLSSSITNYDIIQVQYSDIDLVRCN